MRSRALAILAVCLLLAGAAVAHAGPHRASQQRIVGDTLVIFFVDANLTMSGTDLPVVVELSDIALGEPLDAKLRGVAAPLATPDRTVPMPFVGKGNGSFGALARFDEPGAWRLDLAVDDAGPELNFTFEVYPKGRFTFASSNAASEAFPVGRPARVLFQVVEVASGAPGPAPSDAVVRIERWTDDHQAMLWERTERLAATGAEGELALAFTFPEAGMYHLWVGAASLGLAPGERPMFHAYAAAPEEAGFEVDRWIPAWGFLGVVLALAVAASRARVVERR